MVTTCYIGPMALAATYRDGFCVDEESVPKFKYRKHRTTILLRESPSCIQPCPQCF